MRWTRAGVSLDRGLRIADAAGDPDRADAERRRARDVGLEVVADVQSLFGRGVE